MLVLIALLTFLGLVLLLAGGVARARQRNPVILLAAVWGAFLVYEAYMDFIWEKTVHAPIRADLLLLVPALIGATIVVALVYVARGRTEDH